MNIGFISPKSGFGLLSIIVDAVWLNLNIVHSYSLSRNALQVISGQKISLTYVSFSFLYWKWASVGAKRIWGMSGIEILLPFTAIMIECNKLLLPDPESP